MKRKNTDTMREIGLWIEQIIVPAGLTVSALTHVPEIREAVTNRFNSLKRK